MIGQDDAVGAVGDHIGRERVHIVAAQEAYYLVAEWVGQFAGLAGELEADFGDHAVGVLDEYPD